MPASLSASENLSKARAYCARQERCQQEVRDKLYAWGARQRDVEAIISQLIGEGYLNEARFAAHFAVSKARQKGWGVKKIEVALKARRISAPCIALGLRAIDPEEQLQQLQKAMEKRRARISDSDPYIREQKLIRYFLGKGFTRDMIEAALTALKVGDG